MNCDESFKILYQFIDGDVDAITSQQIELHIQFCRPCWDRFEFEKRLKQKCKSSCDDEPCPERLLKRIKALLDQY